MPFTIASYSHGVVSLLNEDVRPKSATEHDHPSSLQQEDEKRTAVYKRKFHCKSCGKCFPNSGYLSRHAKTHTDDKPFACPWPGCEKSLRRRDNLVQHYRVHLPSPERMIAPVYVRARLEEMEAKRNETESSDKIHGFSEDSSTAFNHQPSSTSPSTAQRYSPVKVPATSRTALDAEESSPTLTHASSASSSPPSPEQRPRRWHRPML